MLENEKPKNVTVKKPSIAKELSEYAVNEIIVPKSTEIVYDLLTGVINMFSDAAVKVFERKLYPNGAPKRNNKSTNGCYTWNTNSLPHTNYSAPRNYQVQTSRSSYDLYSIWVDDEDKAYSIISTLKEEIDNYGKAKVATLYEQIPIQTNFADFKFGWTQEHLPKIGYYKETTGENKGKWFIDVPKPVNIVNV